MSQSIMKLMSSSTARTTSATETHGVPLPFYPEGAEFFLDVLSLTGSSATLIVSIQEGWQKPSVSGGAVGGTPTASWTTEWTDVYTFTQVTTSTATRIMKVPGTTAIAEFAQAANNASSNTQKAGPIADMFRVAWQVGGTSPSATFTVVGRFFGNE